jgi:predicted phosphoribosyltransferase
MRYADRAEAGEVLAARLTAYAGAPATIVLGLPRGGVPVAAGVATALHLPLDVLIVRKLGLPRAPEVAFGALGPHGVRVLNDDLAKSLSSAEIQAVVDREAVELQRQERVYRSEQPPVDVDGKVVLIIDDGLATGATARAAVAVTRLLGAARVVVAVPVGGLAPLALLDTIADEVVCPLVPEDFAAVSRHYRDFTQIDDEAVLAALAGGA